MATSLTIAILTDAAKATKELNALGQKTDSFGAKVGAAGKIIGTAFAAGAVIDFGKKALDAADEAAKAASITKQIIDSTGGAAQVSAKHVDDLTSHLSAVTGVEDEAVRAGSNILLTFKNVKNEGDGTAAVFDRANAAALDLAAVGFGSIESSSKMLGKALNDPVGGMTALSRAGVQFTDQQKEQVKTLVESNDMLGAQKIVLGEVESQVGGTAEASATSSDKMKVALQEAFEKIGSAIMPVVDQLLPVLAQLLDQLLPLVMPLITAVAAFAGQLIQALAPSLGAIIQLAVTLLNAFLPLLPAILSLVTAVTPLIIVLANLLAAIAPLIAGPLAVLASAIAAIATPIGYVIEKISSLISWLEKLISGPIKRAGDAIKGLGGLIDKIPGVNIGGGGKAAGAYYGAGAGVGALGIGPTAVGGGGAYGGGGVTVNVYGDVGDPVVLGRRIVGALEAWTAANGRRRLADLVAVPGVVSGG